MKTLRDYVQTTGIGSDRRTVEWICPAIVCSDVTDYLCRIGQPMDDQELLRLAAQAVDFVDHFEHAFVYVDFSVRAESSDGDWIGVRVELDLTPKPIATLSLTPMAQTAVRIAAEIAA